MTDKEKEIVKNKIRRALQGHTTQECLDAIESLGKELRKANSIRISAAIRGNRPLLDFDERPDMIELKQVQ